MKKLLNTLKILTLVSLFAACKEEIPSYTVGIDYEINMQNSDLPEGTTVFFEVDIHGQEESNRYESAWDYYNFSYEHNRDVWHYLNTYTLNEGLYKVDTKTIAHFVSHDGSEALTRETNDSYYITVRENATNHKVIHNAYLSEGSSGGGGGGGGDEPSVTDADGHDLSSWTETSSGNYRKEFLAIYEVSGNYQAYPSTTYWTHTVTVEYRPYSNNYVLYEPYFNPNSNGGLGLGYTNGIYWGYNSVRVHTYTYHDYNTHVTYEADCYCRFTIN